MDVQRTAQSPLPVQLAGFEEPRTQVSQVVAAVLAIALAGTLGWMLGGRLTQEPPVQAAPAERIASLGPLRFDLDGTWAPVPAKGELARMGVRDLDVFAPVAGLPGRSWIARAPAHDRTLVPAGIRARLAQPLGAPQRATVAGHAAWSYGTLALRSGGRLELTVLPSTAGMVLVGCEAANAWWNTVAGCTRSVRALGGATALAPAADVAFRARVGNVVRVLNRKRLWAGRALRRARKPAGQRAAALRLARANRAAATALAPVVPKRGHAADVVRRLGASAAAYHALGYAAGRRWRSRYAAARKRAHRADATLRQALRRATA
jgi:hypothetical protein